MEDVEVGDVPLDEQFHHMCVEGTDLNANSSSGSKGSGGDTLAMLEVHCGWEQRQE